MKKTDKIIIPNNLDWELLKRFNVCIHATSFAEAASQIGTSQAALIKQINNLEEQIGVPLFVRMAKNRSLELTAEGKILASITQNIDKLVKNQILNRLAQPINIEEKKHIKIITTPGLSTTLLPSIISDFLHENNDVKFELTVKSNPVKINPGEIIIRHNFLPQQNFKAIQILTLPVSLYASKTYLSKNGIPVSYEDLIKHRLLSMKYFDISNTDKYALDQESFIYLEPYIKSDYVSFLIEMALKDWGIIELPSIHPATNKLVKIPLLNFNKQSIYAGFLNVAAQENIIYQFIDYLKKRSEHQ